MLARGVWVALVSNPVIKDGLYRGTIAYDGARTGRPVGRTITKRFTVALTARQYLALNEVATFEGQTMTAIVRRAITQELRRLGANYRSTSG